MNEPEFGEEKGLHLMGEGLGYNRTYPPPTTPYCKHHQPSAAKYDDGLAYECCAA